MPDPRERTIIYHGERFAWYAGPFTDAFEAHDYLAAMIERGEVSEAVADTALILNNNVFLLVPDQPA